MTEEIYLNKLKGYLKTIDWDFLEKQKLALENPYFLEGFSVKNQKNPVIGNFGAGVLFDKTHGDSIMIGLTNMFNTTEVVLKQFNYHYADVEVVSRRTQKIHEKAKQYLILSYRCDKSFFHICLDGIKTFLASIEELKLYPQEQIQMRLEMISIFQELGELLGVIDEYV